MKKGLKALIIVLCCLIVIAGGIFAFVKLTPPKSVEVIPVNNWLMNYMPNQTYMYGIVTSDESATITKSEQRKVTEVLKNVGDSVKVGDPLVRYDATMDGIQLDEKRLEKEKLYNELQTSYKEYERYARTPYPRTIPTATPQPTKEPNPVTANNPVHGKAIRLSAAAAPRYDLSTPTGGDGSEGNPFVFSVTDGDAVPAAFISGLRQQAAEQASTLFVRLEGQKADIGLKVTSDGRLSIEIEVDDPNPVSADLTNPIRGNGSESDPFEYAFNADTEVSEAFITEKTELSAGIFQSVYIKLEASGFTLALCFNPDGTLSFRLILIEATPTPTAEPTVTPEPSATPEPSEEPIETPHGGGMSREEREEYARELAKGIREKEVQYKQLTLDICKLELSGTDGVVYSTIEGTVAVANDPASINDGETIIEVRGGSGLKIASVVSETELKKYPVGTELEGMSGMSGIMVTVRVSSVSSMPVTTRYDNGGNPNSSGYMVVMDFVSEELPNVGDYIEFSSYVPLSETGAIYLHEAYIGEVDGEDCIFVMRGDVVKKVVVNTGKRIESYIELIDSDLTGEDYIAFPYDKNCRDGAPAEIKENSNYYGW